MTVMFKNTLAIVSSIDLSAFHGQIIDFFSHLSFKSSCKAAHVYDFIHLRNKTYKTSFLSKTFSERRPGDVGNRES